MDKVQAFFIVADFFVLLILYLIIAKRIDFLTRRNELKIGEEIKTLEVMCHNVKWMIRFLFVILYVFSVYIVLTLL